MNDKSFVSIGESKFYGNTSYAQFYAGGTITITPKSGATITKVAITTTGTSYNGYQSSGKYTASSGSVAKKTSNSAIVEWTGSATSAFTLGHDKQIRWTSIVVTYTTSGGGSTPTKLGTPTNLSSSNVTTTSADLLWDAVANASSYTVKIGDTEHSSITATSYSATGLTAGTQYTWTVKAVGDGTNYTTSDYAANANFTTEAEQGDGTTVTWVASEQGYANGVQYTSATVDDNISLAFGDGGNDGKYYDTGTGIRLYAGGKVTVSAKQGSTISRVVLTYSGDSYTGTFSASTGSYSLSSTTGTWTGSASSVVLTNTASTGQARIQKIAITYTTEGGDTPDKTPTTLSWSANTATATIGASNSYPTLTTEPAGLEGVIYDSSDKTVATIAADGTISLLTAGTTTITASYAGNETYAAATDATYTLTVNAAPDNRAEVNITAFTAVSTTLTKNGTTTTSVTNNQNGWTPAYTYSTSNDQVATVSNDGVITAVAKGTAQITVSLNVASDDANYKAGSTTSMSVDITVNNPIHNYTFSSNNTEVSSGSCEEGEAITFPADPAVDGVVFMGWATATIAGTQNDAPSMYKSATMGTTDVTYYAVFATAEGGEAVEKKTQTLQYDTWTYSGSTTNKNGYRLFHSSSYIESASFDRSKLSKVIVYGGTFGGDSYNKLTIGDGTNTWKSVTVSGSSETGTNTYTDGTALSGIGAIRITSNSGSAASSGVRISKVEIFTMEGGTTYSDYCTTVSTKATPTLSFAEATYEATMGEDFDTPVLTMTEGISVTYSSSETGVATVNATTGEVTLIGAGTTTITATFEGNDDYKPATASYTLNVTAATPVFASLEALVAADLASGTEVTVSFENVAIKSFQTVSSTRKGVYFDIQKGGNDIEIYFNGEIPAEWAVGGTLSGTLTNCPWKLYGSTWELAPASGWAWTELTYNAPANYAPAITTQPVSATYEWNESAKDLTVAASGNPVPTYQWYSNTTNSNENGTLVEGATNASYKPSTTTTGTFYYYCVATNSEGSAASSVATITVMEPDVASLPFSFDGGKGDIASTAGMSQSGLGTDYTSFLKLKFDNQGDNVIIHFNEAAKKVTYTIKGNSTSGSYAFDVMESADGVNYTSVYSHQTQEIPATAIPTNDDGGEYTHSLNAESRFVKFVYTTKANGNVALGKINIIAASMLDDPEFAFEQSTYTFFCDKDMQVIATSAAGSTGAITYALTEGNEDEFLIDENAGDIVCGTPGTYIVTATIAEAAGFSEATAICTVKVLEPIVGNSIIVAETDGGCYAMTTTCEGSYFGYLPIKKAGNNKYVVESLDNIHFYTQTTDGLTTIQNTENAQYVQATEARSISYSEDEYKWTNSEGVLTAATEGHGTLQYNTNNPRFTTYATKVGQYASIVDLSNVYVGILLDENNTDVEELDNTYETVVVNRTIKGGTDGNYGVWNTFCMPFDMNEEQINANLGEDAEVKELNGMNVNGTNFNMHFGDAVDGDENKCIEAGKPYMIRVKSTVNTIIVANAEGVAVNTTTAPSASVDDDQGNSITFHGNYAKQFAGVGSFIISSNKFYYVDADAENSVTLKGFRGYITTETSGGSQVRALTFSFDDLITGISTNLEADQDQRIYNLQGLQQSKLQRGVNIVGGRKVIK